MAVHFLYLCDNYVSAEQIYIVSRISQLLMAICIGLVSFVLFFLLP